MLGSKPEPPILANMSTACWMNSERSRGAGRSSTAYIVSAGWPFQKPPVLDMIETSDSVRCGYRIAIVWAIMPPIEAPTTCARSIPRWSSTPTLSPAMSASV